MHREKETKSERERESERERDRQRDRQTDREIKIVIDGKRQEGRQRHTERHKTAGRTDRMMQLTWPGLLQPGATMSCTSMNCWQDCELSMYSCRTSVCSETTMKTCATPADTSSSRQYSMSGTLATGTSACGSEYVTGDIRLV